MSTLIYKLFGDSYKAELFGENDDTLVYKYLDDVYTYRQASDPEKVKAIQERSVRWDDVCGNLRRPYTIVFQRDAKAKWTGNVKVIFPDKQVKYYYQVSKTSKGK